uniref:Uncharacterized protein n=1 Tax=Oryza punctata TaxID=4537 RepID=A0A0E0LKE3_ORYPU
MVICNVFLLLATNRRVNSTASTLLPSPSPPLYRQKKNPCRLQGEAEVMGASTPQPRKMEAARRDRLQR